MTPRSQSTPKSATRAASTSSSNLRAVGAHPGRTPSAPPPQNDHVETAAELLEREEAAHAERVAQLKARIAAEAEAKRQETEARAAGVDMAQWSKLQEIIDQKVKAEVARHEAEMSRQLATMYPVRIDLVEDDEDDLGIIETYEGADMQRRLDEILVLADKFGVITSGTVSKHIRGKNGQEWKGTPVRNQLEKLFRQRRLVKRGWFPPQGSMTGSKSVGKAMNLYARTEAQLDRYIAEQNALATKKRGN